MNILQRGLRIISTLLLVVLLVACGGGNEAGDATDEGENEPAATEEAESGGGEVEVAATEFAFALPEEIPAGETTFTLVNNGEEEHEFALVELKPDAPPVDDLIKLPEKEANKHIKFVGGIRPVAPGETSKKPFTTELASGTTYAYVCFVPSPEKKKPHALLGMYGSFEVQ
jgi:hypothetical protein